MKRESDKYLKLVEWSEEDQCYVGTCPGFMFGGVHGKDQKKVYAELCDVVEEWIAGMQKDGIPLPEATQKRDFSGHFIVRIGKELHKAIYTRSLMAGQSLNSFVGAIIRKEVLHH